RLRQIFGERQIEELRRSYFCISTNLTTGDPVVHDRGPLATWIATSMAVPGVAPPVAYNGDLLCDGGVINNLPTDIMQGLERGATLACSVSATGEVRAPGPGFVLGLPDPDALLRKLGKALRRPSLGEILARSATLTSDTLIQRSAIERADIFIQMPVQDIGMFAWNRLDELIERGYEHALRELKPLRDGLTGVK
ncbi:MAG: patatin-like phospholipase family protein, partial [Stenotrophobium sp.]